MAIRRPLVLLNTGIASELPATDQIPDSSLTANLNSLGGLSGAANLGVFFSGPGALSTYTISSFTRTFSASADQAAARTALELGSAATRDIGTSGAKVPLLSTSNTWSAGQTLNSGGSAYISLDILRADQGAVGETDTGLLDIQTGSGALRLFHNSSLGQRWIAIPRGAAAPQYHDGTALRTIWHSGNFNPNSKANLASPSFTGVLTIGNAFLANAGSTGIEVGRTDGTAGTGYIDFHSGATPADYDVRVQCTGGDGTSGKGTLSVMAGNIDLNSGVGSTVLRHSGAAKLTTSSTGITISGQVESSLPTYNNLTLLAPYTWDSAGDSADYNRPSYTKVDNVVRLRGKVTLAGTHTSNATVNLTPIATLPIGFRPAKRKAFSIFWDTDTPLYFNHCLIFVNTDGTIVFIIAPDQPYPFTEGHFPLDQIWFDLAL